MPGFDNPGFNNIPPFGADDTLKRLCTPLAKIGSGSVPTGPTGIPTQDELEAARKVMYLPRPTKPNLDDSIEMLEMRDLGFSDKGEYSRWIPREPLRPVTRRTALDDEIIKYLEMHAEERGRSKGEVAGDLNKPHSTINMHLLRLVKSGEVVINDYVNKLIPLYSLPKKRARIDDRIRELLLHPPHEIILY